MTAWRGRTLDGRTMVVAAAHNFDARAVLLKYLHVLDVGELTIDAAEPSEQPQIEVRRQGSDAGDPPTRHMELRQWLGAEWGPWRDERDFVLGERL